MTPRASQPPLQRPPVPRLRELREASLAALQEVLPPLSRRSLAPQVSRSLLGRNLRLVFVRRGRQGLLRLGGHLLPWSLRMAGILEWPSGGWWRHDSLSVFFSLQGGQRGLCGTARA